MFLLKFSASEELRVFDEVKAAYEKHTCIRLIQRTNQKDYVKIQRGGGCWSFIGRLGDSQDMSLGSGCLYVSHVYMQVMFIYM